MPTINLGRVGFVQKGTYSGATAYKVNDVVIYNNGTYACIQANTNNLPSNTSYWTKWFGATATDVENTPSGTILATTVQAAINELDTEKVALAGNQTIAGIKTFSSSPIIPNATTATQAIAFGQVIGVGQTWQDVTASRVSGVTYTNTTGKPIDVAICFQINGNAGTSKRVFVDGISMGLNHLYTNNPDNYMSAVINVTVPNNNTYYLESGANLKQWSELR